jgi:hypothetical protein
MRRSIMRRVFLALVVFCSGCGGCVKDDPGPPPPQGNPINTASVGVRTMKKPSFIVQEDAGADAP